MAKARPKPPVDYAQPQSLRVLLEKFLEWLKVHNYSPTTIRSRRDDLMKFVNWCEERSIILVGEVTQQQVERYQRWLANYRRADGKTLCAQSQARFLTSVKVYFRWLTRQHYLTASPASELEMPRIGDKLPKAILTAAEIETILLQPDVTTSRGLRDRAIMETFYSTGIRRAELANLRLADLDKERGMLSVRAGKGGKDRVIPIGERALAWIEQYLSESRPHLTATGDEGFLFVSREGKRWNVTGLGLTVHRYVASAAINKQGSCHLFRHTMATLMLEGGADIRYIQQMLGHVELSTTQIYTRVSDRKLKEVHSNTHPGAKLKRRASIDDQPIED